MPHLPNRARNERNVKIIEAIRAGASMTDASRQFDLSVAAISRMCARNGLVVERKTMVVSK
jgi:hypothetical protein